MFLHKFQGFLSNLIYRGSQVLDYYLFHRNFNHFRAQKKTFFFLCNFSHIWQAVQLEMTVRAIVTLGDVLNKLGKATFVPVGGRRKSLKKKVGRIRVNIVSKIVLPEGSPEHIITLSLRVRRVINFNEQQCEWQ